MAEITTVFFGPYPTNPDWEFTITFKEGDGPNDWSIVKPRDDRPWWRQLLAFLLRR